MAVAPLKRLKGERGIDGKGVQRTLDQILGTRLCYADEAKRAWFVRLANPDGKQ